MRLVQMRASSYHTARIDRRRASSDPIKGYTQVYLPNLASVLPSCLGLATPTPATGSHRIGERSFHPVKGSGGHAADSINLFVLLSRIHQVEFGLLFGVLLAKATQGAHVVWVD